MASKLTKEDQAKAKTYFDKYDKDKEGTIDKAEFRTLISELLEIDPKTTESYINLKFKAADKDASGKMSWDEFLELYAKMKEAFNA